MSFISYAQNYEDVMLWRALKHVKKGFYIDVGAAWPDEHSVTQAFYLNGWRGINVEPNPKLSQLLNACRPGDINLRVAVGEQTGGILISFINDTGLSTVSEQISNFHKENGRVLVQEEIEQIKLEDLCKERIEPGQPIHFLKVDVEGAEEAVLRGNNWNVYRPWILVIEATLPMVQIEFYERWEPILLNANYLFAYADGLNRFYVAKEHDELLNSFKYPPNVFDRFLLSSQKMAEDKAQEAQVLAEQAEIKAQQAQLIAEQAENKAQQAQIRAEQAEARADELESSVQDKIEKQTLLQLDAIYTSFSWRITSPLRFLVKTLPHLRPRPLIRQIKLQIRDGVFYVVRRPKLKSFVLRFLNRMPTLKAFIRQMVKLEGRAQNVQVHKKSLATRLVNTDSTFSSFNNLQRYSNKKDPGLELMLINAISNWHKGSRIDK